MSSTLSFSALTALQAKQFFRRRSNILVLFLFLLAGLYALYQGYADKRNKNATIAAFRQQSDGLVQSMKSGIAADTATKEGKAAYQKSSGLNSGLWNTRLPSYKVPVSTAIYNIGQSDVLTYYYLFTAENFEMQLLKQTEITNPLRALAGHFDVSFWVVYLLPLMILLFCFNALSSESDNGNWRLIAAQGVTEREWLQSKFTLAGVLALILLALVLGSGTIINVVSFRQSLSISDCLFFLTSVAYLTFWLALFYFINCLRQSTAYNALVSGIAWISLCIVIPVAVSRLASILVPVDNTKISTFSRRPQDPRIEADKAFAAGIIRRMGVENPTYKNANTDTSQPVFLLRTYHALHMNLHKERWPAVQQYFGQIEKRQTITDWSALLNPAGSTDGNLTALADNDAAAYHHFTNETEGLHNALHNAFFGSLFTKSNFSKSNYDALPQFQYRRSLLPYSLVAYYVFLFTLSFVLFFWANRILGNETLNYGTKKLAFTTWKTNSM